MESCTLSIGLGLGKVATIRTTENLQLTDERLSKLVGNSLYNKKPMRNIMCYKKVRHELIARDVKASGPVWPSGQIIRPRPRSIWPRPRPHGIWPRPRRYWPRGLEHDIINVYHLVSDVHLLEKLVFLKCNDC